MTDDPTPSRDADAGHPPRALARPPAPGRARIEASGQSLCKTKPSSPHEGDGRDLSDRQHAAVRLLVTGSRVMAIARALNVNKRTLARWRTLPAFAAEVQRLRAAASAQAVRAANDPPRPQTPRRSVASRALARPDAPGRARAEALEAQTCKTKPSARGFAPREPNPFLETVLRLGKEGLSTYSNPAEFRRRLRQAGFEA